MPSFLEGFAHGEVRVSRSNWLYRLYAYWLEHNDGRAPWHRENLCHFMRAALIKAPLAWFFDAQWRWTFLRPFTIICYGLITLLVVFNWQRAETWRDAVGAGLLGLYLLAGTLIGADFVSREEVGKDFSPWGRRATLLASPWVMGFVWSLGLGLIFLEERAGLLTRLNDWLERLGNKLADFFSWLAKGWRWVVPAGLVLAVALALSWRVTLILLATAFTLAALVGGLMALKIRLDEYRWQRRATQSIAVKPPKSPARETLGTTLHFLAAKKRKVCPFIIFDL